MLNRYIKITPLMKTTEPADIQISGFKLFSGDDQVDISNANININFVPVAGNAAMVKRDTIVIGEALVIPKAHTRGRAAIYIDLTENKSFDAFQIGFGESQSASLTKFKIEYSNDGVTYRRFADVTYNVRMKYRNPWTFSGLSAKSTTGFPGLIQRSLHHQFINYQNPIQNRNDYPRQHNVYIGNDGRSMFTRRGQQDIFNGDNSFGSQMQTTLTGLLRRGKYYFEVTANSGINMPGRGAGWYMGINMETRNSGQPGGSWGDWVAGAPVGAVWPTDAAVFSLSTRYSGIRPSNNSYRVNQTLIGGPVPPDFTDRPDGKKGFLGGFAVDTVTGIVRVVNSPFTPEFQFNGDTFVSLMEGNPDNTDKRCYFSIFAPGRHDSCNMDLTFNFGQDAFIGAPPAGFDDRIGMRWELEIDPNAQIYIDADPMDHATKFIPWTNRKDYTDEDVGGKIPSARDCMVDPMLKYYIKGKVTDKDGKFYKRTMELYTFPQMQLVASCASSAEDGTYEFLNLWNRDYIVVSTDDINHKFQSEMIGPLKPVLMDPTK
jgi:hypothetical protein